MEHTIQTIGLIIFSAVFFFSGLKHIRHHADMVSYATAAFGRCPVAGLLGFLGGAPTGLFLTIFGVGTAFNQHSFFAYGLAAFLAVVIAVFHRDLQDPANLKTLGLFGAALYIAAQVH